MSKVLAAVLVAFCAGCATSTPIETAERGEREYRTGSNIPQRVRGGDEPGFSTVDREALQRQRDLSTPQPTPLSPTAPPRTP